MSVKTQEEVPPEPRTSYPISLSAVHTNEYMYWPSHTTNPPLILNPIAVPGGYHRVRKRRHIHRPSRKRPGRGHPQPRNRHTRSAPAHLDCSTPPHPLKPRRHYPLMLVLSLPSFPAQWSGEEDVCQRQCLRRQFQRRQGWDAPSRPPRARRLQLSLHSSQPSPYLHHPASLPPLLLSVFTSSSFSRQTAKVYTQRPTAQSNPASF